MIQSISEFLEELRNFRLFKDLEPVLLKLGVTIKSKIWTIEILTQEMNIIIRDFVESKFTLVEDFFQDWLTQRYADIVLQKQRYCYTLLLSIKRFKELYPYVKIYHYLFSKESEREIYQFFFETKTLALDLKTTSEQDFVNLDKIYLGEKHWQLLLSCCLGYELNQILEFESDLLETVSRIKHEGKPQKVIEYSRNLEYQLTFILREMLFRFTEMQFMNQPNTHSLMPMGREFSSNTKNMIAKLSQSRLAAYASYLAKDSEESLQNKIEEKERLMAEIKNAVQMTNVYKESVIKLVSHFDELDPVLSVFRSKVESIRNTFADFKHKYGYNHALTQELKASEFETTLFLDHGSNLSPGTGSFLKRKILSFNAPLYHRFVARTKEFRPHLRTKIERMRNMIMSGEFTLSNDRRGHKFDQIKAELEKLFSKFGKLENSQRIILNTLFQRASFIGTKSDMKVNESDVDKVIAKLSTLAGKGLGDGKEFEVTDLAYYEASLRQTFDIELEKLDSFTGAFSHKPNQLREQFRKNRYTSKPLIYRKGSIFDRTTNINGADDPEGINKPMFVNFNKTKPLEVSTAFLNEQTNKTTFESYADSKAIEDDDINKECVDESIISDYDDDVPEGVDNFDEFPDEDPQLNGYHNNDSSIHSGHQLSQVSSEHMIETQIDQSLTKSRHYPNDEHFRKNLLSSYYREERQKSASNGYRFS